METQITYIALLSMLGSGDGAMTGFGIATVMTPFNVALFAAARDATSCGHHPHLRLPLAGIAVS